MLFDTDVLIEVQKGSAKGAAAVQNDESRFISIFTYMELMQCARNKEQHRIIKSFLKDFQFTILPLAENIGHRASIYIEEYTLSHSLRAGDAVIAATAVENDMVLCSGNKKHFSVIKELQFRHYRR